MHSVIFYLIVNQQNDKSYVGFTTQTMKKRWLKHVQDAHKGSNYHFHRAIRKYGPDAFTCYEIMRMPLESMERIGAIEKYWISVFDTYSNGYNSTLGGEGVAGLKMSDETRSRLIEYRRGQKHSDETRQRMSESRQGRVFSEDTKRRMSASQRGRVMSDVAKERLSNALRGKKRSDETKAKISKSKRGKKLSEEHRRKLSEARQGKKYGPLSEEHKRKISEATQGKKHGPLSEERKHNLLEASKKWRQSKKSTDQTLLTL